MGNSRTCHGLAIGFLLCAFGKGYSLATNGDLSNEIYAREKAIRSLSTPSRYALTERFHLGAILACCFVVFFLNLGTCRLWDEDEPRNAGAAVEMLQRGDLIVPTFNDELRPQKPILIYWFMIFAYQVIGQNEWGARFWSAVFGTGTVLLTYGIGRRLFCPAVAFWAALVLATNIMFTVASRAATPDAFLIFFSTLTIYLYVRSSFASFHPDRLNTFQLDRPSLFPSVRHSIPIFIAMGFGALAKGPVAVILPCMIIGLFQLVQKSIQVNQEAGNESGVDKKPTNLFQLKTWAGIFHIPRFLKTLWQMHPLVIVGIVLLIAGPWYIGVGWKTDWEFLKIFFLRENLQRATTEMESHSGPFWYHAAAIQVAFFPWSLLSVPVLFALYKMAREPRRFQIWYPGLILVSCWVILQVLVFSVVKTKLPSYVTPCYPALSLIWGVYIHRITRGEKFHPQWFVPVIFGLMALVGITLLIGIGYYLKTPPTKFIDGFVVSLPLLVTAIFGFWIGTKKQGRWFPAVMGIGSFCFVVALFGIGTVMIDGYRKTENLWTHLEKKEDPQAALGAYKSFCSTWVFYARRPIFEIQPIIESSGVVEKTTSDPTMAFQREKFWQKKLRPTLSQFLANFPKGRILVSRTNLQELMDSLPGHYKVLGEESFFLKEKSRTNPETLLIVGPSL